MMDKILKIQTEIGVLSKDKENPFFKSNYLDINSLIAQLLPLLEKHNITVIQPLANISGKPALGICVIDNETGKDLVSGYGFYMPLPELQDPQKMGSAITYYRRYALQSLFLLQTEDDDGNGAKTPAKKNVHKVDSEDDGPF